MILKIICSRALFVECDLNCPVGDLCENRCLQQQKLPLVEVFLLPNGHRGLRSSTVIAKGQIIGEYCGEVINQKQKDYREEQYNKAKEPCNYILGFFRGHYIDARVKGSLTRYINHSCDGNSNCFNMNSEGELKVAIIANRIIQIGEEITFDYGSVFSG